MVIVILVKLGATALLKRTVRWSNVVVPPNVTSHLNSVPTMSFCLIDSVLSVYTLAKAWQNPMDGEDEFLQRTGARITTGRRLKKRIERRIFEHHAFTHNQCIYDISLYSSKMFNVRPGKGKSKGSTHDGAPTIFILFHIYDIYATI